MLTISLVGLALYLQRGESGRAVEQYFVTATYRSDLLDKEVSPDALAAAARRDEFRAVVGGIVEVESQDHSPYLVRVTTSTREEAQRTAAHERALRMLSTKLKESALTEITASLHYIDEFKREASDLQKRRREPGPASGPGPSSRLTEAESGRILLLQKEIQQLQAFFEGGELPKPLRMKLERRTLAEAEKRVRNAQTELAKLARLFHPTNAAVRAQQDYTQKVKDELRSLEEHLAGVYLKTLKLELETLEEKALSIVEEHIADSESSKSVSSGDETFAESEQWIQERERVLQERADSISQAASLKLDGTLEYGERGRESGLLASAFWLAALASFLGLLFRPSLKGLEESKAKAKPNALSGVPLAPPRRPMARLDISTFLSENQASASLDHFEAFFSSIYEEITRALGRPPKRILVLGDHSIELRLAFSIRLANNLGRELGSVRLIDFDLQGKCLSERLGRQMLPGVGDLLLHGGPVDEFFSSIAGTSIQFAPAGSLSVIEKDVDPASMHNILGSGKTVTVIDASSASPLHLVVHQVDAVLFAARDVSLTEKSLREQQVLTAFRDAGLPLWGVSVEQSQFFPLL